MQIPKFPPISKQTYHFNLETYIDNCKGEENESPEKPLSLCCDLTIDFIGRKFWIDMSQPLDVNDGVIILYGHNMFGNVVEKAQASSDTYKWLAEICEFAKRCIHDNKRPSASSDILTDDKVVELAFKFGEFIRKQEEDTPTENFISEKEDIWDDFKRWLNPKPKPVKKHKPKRDLNDERFDLDDDN